MKNTDTIAFELYNNTHLDWDSLSSTQQLDEMKEYTRLKRLATIERLENEAEQKLLEEQSSIDRKNNIISYMKTLGYTGDGSLDDYKKLYNKPSIFGKNHESLAVEVYENSENKLDDFIQLFLRS